MTTRLDRQRAVLAMTATMADEIDMAQAAEAKMTSAGIEGCRQALHGAPKLTPRFECLNPNCGEVFDTHESQRLFCGAACAEEYEIISKRNHTK